MSAHSAGRPADITTLCGLCRNLLRNSSSVLMQVTLPTEPVDRAANCAGTIPEGQKRTKRILPSQMSVRQHAVQAVQRASQSCSPEQ